MKVEKNYKKLSEEVKNKKINKRKKVFIKKLLYEDQRRVDVIIAKNKIEEEILKFLKEIYCEFISAKDISFLLSAGKNIAYEEEDLLIFMRISKSRKTFIAKSLLILIRVKNCHEVVLKNLLYLIKERKRKLGI